MEILILILYFCAFSGSSVLLDNVEQKPLVYTQCGHVRGTHSTSYVFKGIPSALSPTGVRRWKPPEPLNRSTNTCWSGKCNPSIQRSMDNSGSVIGSEDCLFLNVCTPTLDKNANLPVMV